MLNIKNSRIKSKVNNKINQNSNSLVYIINKISPNNNLSKLEVLL